MLIETLVFMGFNGNVSRLMGFLC